MQYLLQYDEGMDVNFCNPEYACSCAARPWASPLSGPVRAKEMRRQCSESKTEIWGNELRATLCSSNYVERASLLVYLLSKVASVPTHNQTRYIPAARAPPPSPKPAKQDDLATLIRANRGCTEIHLTTLRGSVGANC